VVTLRETLKWAIVALTAEALDADSDVAQHLRWAIREIESAREKLPPEEPPRGPRGPASEIEIAVAPSQPDELAPGPTADEPKSSAPADIPF
jgi:hypothetical protein